MPESRRVVLEVMFTLFAAKISQSKHDCQTTLTTVGVLHETGYSFSISFSFESRGAHRLSQVPGQSFMRCIRAASGATGFSTSGLAGALISAGGAGGGTGAGG